MQANPLQGGGAKVRLCPIEGLHVGFFNDNYLVDGRSEAMSTVLIIILVLSLGHCLPGVTARLGGHTPAVQSD